MKHLFRIFIPVVLFASLLSCSSPTKPHQPNVLGADWRIAWEPEQVPNIQDVTYGDGIFVGISISGEVFVSETGVNWEHTATPTLVGDTTGNHTRFLNITWTGSLFLTTGENGTIIYSEDARSWAQANIDSNDWIVAIIPGETGMMALPKGNGIFYSTDGRSWEPILNHYTAGRFLSGIWANNTFILSINR